MSCGWIGVGKAPSAEVPQIREAAAEGTPSSQPRECRPYMTMNATVGVTAPVGDGTGTLPEL